MEIGTIIKRYRKENNLSLRDFAIKCGTSHSYIAMLENKKNSKTGEPIIPTITMLIKIANALDMNVNDLISICDDMPVTLGTTQGYKTSPTEVQLNEGEREILKVYRRASDNVKPVLIKVVESLEEMPIDKLKVVADLLSKQN